MPTETTGCDRFVKQSVLPRRSRSVIEDPQNIMLEVGPGQTLSQLARQHAKKPDDVTVIPSLGPVGDPGSDLSSMLAALGRLWVAGVGIDWEAFSAGERRRRVPLPTYPFERKRYWIEPVKDEALAPAAIDADVSTTPFESRRPRNLKCKPLQS